MGVCNPFRRGIYGAAMRLLSVGSLAGASWLLGAPLYAAAPKAAATQKATSKPAARIPLPKHRKFRPAQIGRVIFVLNDPGLVKVPIPKLVIKNRTVQQVFRQFRKLSGQNMVMNWMAVKASGTRLKNKCSFTLPAQSLRLDMAATLKTFARHHRFVISADENVIFLTTQKQDDEHLVFKSYYLQDLQANLPRIIRGGKDLEKLNGDPKSLKKVPLPTNIVQLISSTVRPHVWEGHGGRATISQVGNRVIVIAPASVQAILKGPKHYNPNAVPRYIMYGF